MKRMTKISLVAGLALAASLALAAGPGRGDCSGGMPMMQGMQGMQGMKGGMDPARMQAMMDRRHAALKAQLKITASQESAWKAFTDSAMMGKMGAMQRPDPAEMVKLSTPQRLEKMQAMHAEHTKQMGEAMDKHIAATKALYAVLTPEQQKLFDAQAMPGAGQRGQQGKHGQHRGMGGGKGPGMMQPGTPS